MSRLMLDRELLIPPHFAERDCLMVRYCLPALPHCYVLCHESGESCSAATPTRPELFSFFIQQAEELALDAVGDRQAFVLIHSGASIRSRANLHVHVFVVKHRWQKAWLYLVIGIKNLAQAVCSSWRAKRPGRSGETSARRSPRIRA